MIQTLMSAAHATATATTIETVTITHTEKKSEKKEKSSIDRYPRTLWVFLRSLGLLLVFFFFQLWVNSTLNSTSHRKRLPCISQLLSKFASFFVLFSLFSVFILILFSVCLWLWLIFGTQQCNLVDFVLFFLQQIISEQLRIIGIPYIFSSTW